MVEREVEMNSAYVELVYSKRAYKGIQVEGGDLFRYLKGEYMKQYLGLFEGERIHFSENNLVTLMYLNSHIKDHEIIVYGDNKIVFPESVNSIFIGYDISGDSMFLSPLYTFFGNDGGMYFQKIQSKTPCGVNEYGLFDNWRDAIDFIEFINEVNDDNFFEKDGLLKPVFVYICK